MVMRVCFDDVRPRNGDFDACIRLQAHARRHLIQWVPLARAFGAYIDGVHHRRGAERLGNPAPVVLA